MPPTEIAEFEKIAASLAPQAVAIAGGDRPCDLGLYRQLRGKPYVRQCILVGNLDDMRAAAEQLGVELAEEDVVATDSQEETATQILDGGFIGSHLVEALLARGDPTRDLGSSVR